MDKNKPVKVYVLMLNFLGQDGRSIGAHPVHIYLDLESADKAMREFEDHAHSRHEFEVEECWTSGIQALQEWIYKLVQEADNVGSTNVDIM